MQLAARTPAQARAEKKTIRVFTSRSLREGLFSAREVVEEHFCIEAPCTAKSFMLGNYGGRSAADLQKIAAKLSALGAGVRLTRRKWPRDCFLRLDDALIIAFEHGLWQCLAAPLFNSPMPMGAGEGGALLAGKDFILASQALPRHALDQLRACFGNRRIHVVPALYGTPHIDCFIGVIPSRGILLADPWYARIHKGAINFLKAKEGLEPVLIPEEERRLNPANFLLVKNGGETVLLNHAPRTAEALAKHGVPVALLDAPLETLNKPFEHGLRCASNEAEEGLLEAVVARARGLFGRIEKDPRFRRVSELVSGLVPRPPSGA
ncbi:MAG: hypothetical protein QXH27_05135 [Candidatus Micrarchaeia archaeon]